MQESLQAAQLQRIEDMLVQLLEKAVKKPKKNTAQRPAETVESPWFDGGVPSTEQVITPQWFSLGHELPGWIVSFEVADKWRQQGGFSEAYCLDKIYVVRGWWTKDHEKKGRNPYATFQQACRHTWGDRQTFGQGGGREHGRPGDNPQANSQEDNQQERLQQMANQRGHPVGGVQPRVPEV